MTKSKNNQPPNNVENAILNAIADYTRQTRDTTLSITGWGGRREGAVQGLKYLF